MTLGRIQAAGAEDLVLTLAAAGKSTREIAKRLRAELGLEVSHALVGRFLRDEARARETARRSVGAERAHAVTARAGEEAVEHVEALERAAKALVTMAVDGYRVVRLPGAPEIVEPVEARDQVQAARHLRGVLGYLVDLAAGRPRSTDANALEAALAAAARVYGVSLEDDASDPLRAPPDESEHTPPSLN